MSNSFSRIVVCVPERWREGRSHIKGFIEHYCEAVGKKIVVDLSPDMGVREIWVADAGKLSRAEYEAADCAIQILNEGLTRAKDIVWNNRLPETKPASGVTGQGLMKKCWARLGQSLGLKSPENKLEFKKRAPGKQP